MAPFFEHESAEPWPSPYGTAPAHASAAVPLHEPGKSQRGFVSAFDLPGWNATPSSSPSASASPGLAPHPSHPGPSKTTVKNGLPTPESMKGEAALKDFPFSEFLVETPPQTPKA